jgi:hypothetical protein
VGDLKDRQLKAGDEDELEFEFARKFKNATPDQIEIIVNFEEGCSVTFEPGDIPFVCRDAKSITELTMIWNGSGPVTVKTPGIPSEFTISRGEEITVKGLGGLGNDINWQISGANNGISTFHVSCSDEDMNGPEDCGKPQGDGKDKGKDGRLNLWIFEGMAGNLSLDCNP